MSLFKHFTSFDDVARRYESIKPIVSKNFTMGDDVRPIADRRRQYERIKKLNDTTYLLLDGVFFPMTTSRSPKQAVEFEAHTAPIIWTREDGHDHIQVRLVPDDSYLSTVRIGFLYEYLPYNLVLNTSSRLSKLRVFASTVGTRTNEYDEFILPKFTAKYDHKQNTYTTDELFLKFRKNKDGTWVRVSKPMEIRTDRVDKDAKKLLKPHIEGFYATCCVYREMLFAGNRYPHSRTSVAADQLRDWLHDHWSKDFEFQTYSNWVTEVPPHIVKQIIVDEEHPMRIEFATMVIYQTGLYGRIETKEDVSTKRAAFNRLMNQALDLRKTEAV